jgi:hypothetical protein
MEESAREGIIDLGQEDPALEADLQAARNALRGAEEAVRLAEEARRQSVDDLVRARERTRAVYEEERAHLEATLERAQERLAIVEGKLRELSSNGAAKTNGAARGAAPTPSDEGSSGHAPEAGAKPEEEEDWYSLLLEQRANEQDERSPGAPS